MLGELPRDVLVGAVEGGGTKFVCAVGTNTRDLARSDFPNAGSPERVLAQITGW